MVYLLMAVGSLRSFGQSGQRGWLLVSAVLVIGFLSTWVTRGRQSASSHLSDLTKSGV